MPREATGARESSRVFVNLLPCGKRHESSRTERDIITFGKLHDRRICRRRGNGSDILGGKFDVTGGDCCLLRFIRVQDGLVPTARAFSKWVGFA
jgi:hypothetical protein